MLAGSITVTGAAVQWHRDRLGIFRDAPEVEELAKSVDDKGGVYFVPAFSGLFAPYWRENAHGIIVGLAGSANKGHIARATLRRTRTHATALRRGAADRTFDAPAELH